MLNVYAKNVTRNIVLEIGRVSHPRSTAGFFPSSLGSPASIEDLYALKLHGVPLTRTSCYYSQQSRSSKFV